MNYQLTTLINMTCCVCFFGIGSLRTEVTTRYLIIPFVLIILRPVLHHLVELLERRQFPVQSPQRKLALCELQRLCWQVGRSCKITWMILKRKPGKTTQNLSATQGGNTGEAKNSFKTNRLEHFWISKQPRFWRIGSASQIFSKTNLLCPVDSVPRTNIWILQIMDVAYK